MACLCKGKGDVASVVKVACVERPAENRIRPPSLSIGLHWKWASMEDGKKLDLYRWPFSFFPNLRTDEVVDAWPACINHQTTPFINGNQTFLFCFCCLG